MKKYNYGNSVSDSPLVIVTWVDANSSYGWRDPEDMRMNSGLQECTSVGFMVVYNRKYISVAQSHNALEGHGSHWADLISIPRSCIQSIKILREPKEKWYAGEGK